MKGFVPTPPRVVDQMVAKLFRNRPPHVNDRLLDPGCGTGAFVEGVIRWCSRTGSKPPQIVAIDSDPKLLNETRERFGHLQNIKLLKEDFLKDRQDRFDFVIGNPPYVPITGLTIEERTRYRRRYQTAVGRFDLYLLFFEQALKLLAPEGRLVFITPEKFLYTQTAAPLRRQLASNSVEEVHLIAESVFGNLITYPTITTVTRVSRRAATRVILRDGTTRKVTVSPDRSWLPGLNGVQTTSHPHVLGDAAQRISCGVATGADSVFVVENAGLANSLKRFAHPTVSGRSLEVGSPITTTHSMLIPYDDNGALLEEHELGVLGKFLRQPEHKARLLERTCVLRKPWYSFHENPPMADILVPKILCKDIGPRPWFVVDEHGSIVPRHSVYYIVPRRSVEIQELCAFLNSAEACEWLTAHCQRAANGFLRLQSHVLRQIPIPEEFVPTMQLALA